MFLLLISLSSKLVIVKFVFFKGYEDLQKARKSEAHDDGTEEIMAQASFGQGWSDLPKMLLLLVSKDQLNNSRIQNHNNSDTGKSNYLSLRW